MKDRFYIDGIDAYLAYGVCILQGGYKDLLSFPSLKEPEKIDWAERDGIDVDLTSPKLDSKKISISFCANSLSGMFDFVNILADASYHDFVFAEIGLAKKLRTVSMSDISSSALNKFSLEFSDDFPLVQYSGFNSGGRNLISDSIINQSSNLYGFGYRTVQVEAGNTYTFSASGNAANALNGKTLRIFIYKEDWSWANVIIISESVDTIKSITFSVTETVLLHVQSYYSDDSQPRTGSVYTGWYKLEEGSEATNWLPSVDDLINGISEYAYVSPESSVEQQGYVIDEIDLSNYGVTLLQGSNDEILKKPAVKQNLEINSNFISGVVYDDTALIFKEKDVRLNCLLLATNIVEFWRNYNALLFDLSKPNYRTFEYDGEMYTCFYKSSSVKKFSNSGRIWCEFELNLVFVR